MVTRQVPVTLELRNTPGKNTNNPRWYTHISQLTQFMPPPETYRSDIGSQSTMCQVHTGAYVSLLATGKTGYTACHPRQTTTYVLHVVLPLRIRTTDASQLRKQTKKRKGNKGKERREKKAKKKTKQDEKGKQREEKDKKSKKRQDRKARKEEEKKRKKEIAKSKVENKTINSVTLLQNIQFNYR